MRFMLSDPLRLGRRPWLYVALVMTLLTTFVVFVRYVKHSGRRPDEFTYLGDLLWIIIYVIAVPYILRITAPTERPVASQEDDQDRSTGKEYLGGLFVAWLFATPAALGLTSLDDLIDVIPIVVLAMVIF